MLPRNCKKTQGPNKTNLESQIISNLSVGNQSILTLSNMVVPCHMWLFKFKLRFSFSVVLIIFQVLNSCMWLVATILDCEDIEDFHHWSKLDSFGSNSLTQISLLGICQKEIIRQMLKGIWQKYHPNHYRVKNQKQTKHYVFIKNQVAVNIHDIQVSEKYSYCIIIYLGRQLKYIEIRGRVFLF